MKFVQALRLMIFDRKMADGASVSTLGRVVSMYVFRYVPLVMSWVDLPDEARQGSFMSYVYRSNCTGGRSSWMELDMEVWDLRRKGTRTLDGSKGDRSSDLEQRRWSSASSQGQGCDRWHWMALIGM